MNSRILTLCCLIVLGGNVYAEEADKSPVTPAKPAAAAKPKVAAPSANATVRPANDQLTLDATVVTGNRELPKVMYIVPWKKAELGTLPGQPFNTLVDETLAPVDREVFKREVAYYGVVSDKDRAAAASAPDVQATPGTDRK